MKWVVVGQLRTQDPESSEAEVGGVGEKWRPSERTPPRCCQQQTLSCCSTRWPFHYCSGENVGVSSFSLYQIQHQQQEAEKNDEN